MASNPQEPCGNDRAIPEDGQQQQKEAVEGESTVEEHQNPTTSTTISGEKQPEAEQNTTSTQQYHEREQPQPDRQQILLSRSNLLSELIAHQQSSSRTKLYGRETEFGVLKEAWQRCCHDQHQEIVVIYGGNGTGKSALVNALKPIVTASSSCAADKKQQAFFLCGPFTESHHPQKGPCQVFVKAISEYVDQLLDMNDSVLIATCRSRVDAAVGNDERGILLDLIPALKKLLVKNNNNNNNSSDSNNARKQQQRGPQSNPAPPPHCQEPPRGNELVNHLRNVFSKVVAAITSTTPLFLFLDNFQWADTPSLDFLRSLLQPSHNIPLLVVAAVRTKSLTAATQETHAKPAVAVPQETSFVETAAVPESFPAPRPSIGSVRTEDQDSIAERKSAVRRNRKKPYRAVLKEFKADKTVRVTPIDLKNLDLENVQAFVAETLGKQPSEVAELSRIAHDQTQGNIFHVLQFLRLLVDQGILFKNNSNNNKHGEGGSWMLDEERMQKEIGESTSSILDLVLTTMRSLPRPVQQALMVASCLGTDIDTSAVDRVLQTQAGPLLRQAQEEGLLIFSPEVGGYRFSHYWMQRAAFELIEKDERPEFHLNIGRRLWRSSSRTALENNILLIVSLMNVGSELVTEVRGRYQLAELNLMAGQKALSLGSLADASAYLRKGLEMLGPNCWSERYQLALELHNLAADVEISNGKFDMVAFCINEVVEHGACLDDKLPSFASLLKSMEQQGDLEEAISLSFSILQQLGEPLPSSASKLTLMKEIMRVRMALRGKSDEAILGLPRMADVRIIDRMKFLVMGFWISFRSKKPHTPLFALRSVMLSLRYGIHESSAIGFVMYGVVLHKIDPTQAYRFGQLAISLADMDNSAEFLPWVYVMFGVAINHWTHPLQNSLDSLEYAWKVGLETGNVRMGLMAQVSACTCAFALGRKLSVAKRKVTESLKLSKLYRQRNSQLMLSLTLQGICCYEGAAADPSRLTGNMINFDESLRASLESHDQSRLIIQYQLAAELAFTFGDIAEASKMASKCLEIIKTSPASSFYACLLKFYYCLIGIALSRQGVDPGQNTKLARGFLNDFTKWSKGSPATFLHLKVLLEAEMMSLKQPHREDAIQRLYADAFSLSQNQDNPRMMALASEKYGDFLATKKKVKLAQPEWKKAADLYEEWGALAKSEQLRERIDTS